MRYLLVFHSIGAEMRGIASWLSEQPESRVILAMDRGHEDFDLPKIERILLKKPDLKGQPEFLPDYMTSFMRRAEKSWYSFRNIAAQGYEPDIILAHSSTGTAFGLRSLFPKAFIVNYLVSMMAFSQVENDAVNCLQTLQITNSSLSFAFTESTRKSQPEILRRKIDLAPLAVDTEYFTRVNGYNFIKNSSKLVVFWLKKLNLPDFAKWLNLIIKLVSQKSDISVAILAPNIGMLKAAEDLVSGLSSEIVERIWMKCFPTRIIRREVFSAADMFITPANELNLDMLEAMSCGCAVMTAAKNDMLKPDFNCIKLPSRSLLDSIEDWLSSPSLRNIALRGRFDVVEKHSVNVVVPGHMENIIDAKDKYRGA